MVLAYPIFPMVSLSDFIVFHILLCQLVVSPGVLPGRLISACFPPLGATLLFRVYMSTDLAHCLVIAGLISY